MSKPKLHCRFCGPPVRSYARSLCRHCWRNKMHRACRLCNEYKSLLPGSDVCQRCNTAYLKHAADDIERQRAADELDEYFREWLLKRYRQRRSIDREFAAYWRAVGAA